MHIRKWTAETFRFRGGDIEFVRSFVEESHKKRRDAAETWGRRMGYEFVGPVGPESPPGYSSRP